MAGYDRLGLVRRMARNDPMKRAAKTWAKQVITREQWRADVSEHALQKLVISMLKACARPDVFWFAVPNAGWRPGAIGARMKAEGLAAGVADLCIMLAGGKTCWLEMKTKTGRQTPEQKTFELVCQQLGHPYALARSLDEATDVLNEWGVLK